MNNVTFSTSTAGWTPHDIQALVTSTRQGQASAPPGGLANNVQPSGGIRSRLGTLGAYSQGAWNSLAQITSRRREPEWIPVQVQDS